MNTSKTFCAALFLACFTIWCTAGTALASGTSASIVVSGNEGAIGVHADATFEEYPNSNAGTLSVSRNNSHLGSKSGNGAASWSTVVNGGLLAQGAHTFRATATDSKGNSDSATQTINIDNTPAITVTADEPDGDMHVRGTVDFKENTEGAEGTVYLYLVYPNGYAPEHGHKSYEGADLINWTYKEIVGHVFNAGGYANGKYKIKARAVAANGAETTEFHPFTINNTPAVTVTAADSEGDMWVHGTVDFKENATGAEGTLYLYLVYPNGYAPEHGHKSYEGADLINWTYEEIVGQVFNAGGYANGEYKIKARAVVANGAETTEFHPFTINNTPAVTVTAADSEGDMGVHGTVDFKENSTGAEGTLYLYLVYPNGYAPEHGHKSYEGADLINWTYEEIVGQVFNAGGYANGEYKIKARAVAANGAETAEFHPFTINNTPAVTVTAADSEGNMGVHGTVDFKENSTGAEGTVYLYLVYPNGYAPEHGHKSYEGADLINWTYKEIVGHVFNAGGYANGKYIIKVRAVAANGAEKSEYYLLTVDNTPKPSIDMPPVEFADKTFDIVGTVLFKDNDDGVPNTADPEGSVTLYISTQIKNPTFSQHGSSRSYEGKTVSWKYSDFTNARLSQADWGIREYLVKIVARAANGATAEVIKNPLIPPNGCPFPPADDCDDCQK